MNKKKRFDNIDTVTSQLKHLSNIDVRLAVDN